MALEWGKRWFCLLEVENDKRTLFRRGRGKKEKERPAKWS